MKNSKPLAKTHSKVIKYIAEKAVSISSFSLSNNFIGEEIFKNFKSVSEIEQWIKSELPRSRATINYETGVVEIDVH